MTKLRNLYQTQKAKVRIRSNKLAVKLVLIRMLTYLDHLIRKLPGVITMFPRHRRIYCKNNLTLVSQNIALRPRIRQNLEGTGIEDDNLK